MLFRVLLLVLFVLPLLGLSLDSSAVGEETLTFRYYENLGHQLHDQKRYAESIKAYDKAIQLCPTDGYLYSSRASSYTRCLQYKQALADMLTAMKYDPRNSAFCLKYAAIANADDKTAQEIDGYTRCLALEPENCFVLVQRARAYRTLRDFDHSLKDYNAALTLYPTKAKWNRDDFGDVCRERGLIWIYRKEYARAISDFSNGLKYLPNNTALIRNRADAYFSSGQGEKAIQDLSRCIALEPKENSRMSAMQRRAAIYLDLKNYPKALADANQLLEHNQDDVDTLMLRAKIYAADGKPDLAQKDRQAIAKYQEEMAPPKD
jgi:tetratricopeptide (TPR) repeat protein